MQFDAYVLSLSDARSIPPPFRSMDNPIDILGAGRVEDETPSTCRILTSK